MIQGSKLELGTMRYELNDYEWRIIKPMLPNKPRGVPRVDGRRVLNGSARPKRSVARPFIVRWHLKPDLLTTRACR